MPPQSGRPQLPVGSNLITALSSPVAEVTTDKALAQGSETDGTTSNVAARQVCSTDDTGGRQSAPPYTVRVLVPSLMGHTAGQRRSSLCRKSNVKFGRHPLTTVVSNTSVPLR